MQGGQLDGDELTGSESFIWYILGSPAPGSQARRSTQPTRDTDATPAAAALHAQEAAYAQGDVQRLRPTVSGHLRTDRGDLLRLSSSCAYTLSFFFRTPVLLHNPLVLSLAAGDMGLYQATLQLRSTEPLSCAQH